MDSRQQGLTLVELMIVVAVMAVIAAVAYPLYTGQTQKARRADAKVALETIAMAQERVYTLSGRYWGIGTSTLQAQLPAPLRAAESEQGYYTIAVTQGTNQDFTATATAKSGGAQGGDASNCATFSITHQGVKSHTGSASNCW